MKKWVPVSAALFCAIAVIISSASGQRKGREKAEESARPAPVPVRLNDTLSNGMSDIPELTGMDSSIEKFLKRWEIRGASLAIMRNDSLVYAKGYGWADVEDSVRMEPGNILRMASVSKLITAT